MPKKTLPPGTFIPTPQRIMAIGQLCFAFSLVIWYIAQPFMGEHFALRSRMLLYEYVMGTSEVFKSEKNQAGTAERQIHRFQQLPATVNNQFNQDYQILRDYSKRSALKKIEDGIHFLFFEIPSFELAWIFFSITLAILILLKREGAKQAAWILPLIVIAYIVDNQSAGKMPYVAPDLSLFPSENELIENYLSEPLALDFLGQKKQLEKGWELYLFKNWLGDSKNNQGYQKEQAEFNFTTRRLQLLHNQSFQDWLHPFHEKLGYLTLALYLLWNVFFAWIMNREKEKLLCH